MNPLDQPTSVTGLLREFWTRVRGGEDKLSLLRDWAERRPTLRSARSFHAVRREHNQQRLTARWRGRHCFVCDALASQQHHIIQIQHGGTNRPLNKVWVCTSCHRQIHPFMPAAPQPVPVGVVPHTAGTEQATTCYACGAAVIRVQPVLRKRAVSQSQRPIFLQVNATSPYRTTDLHQQYCGDVRAFKAVLHADLSRLAAGDGKPTRDRVDSDWSAPTIDASWRQVRHG